eukprot:jgi/Undpi1/10650/HiC_scaffold_29.g13100.m1
MAQFERQTVGSRGGGFGLDAELARQREAKYDHGAEDEARAWIEAITKEPCAGPFGEALRDGSVRRVNESRMPFKQMENISNFLKARHNICTNSGCVVYYSSADHVPVVTVDLFENKDLGLVVRCVFALGSSVQRTCPDFPGPHLGAKLHKENKRVFNDQQKQQARVNASFSKISMGSAQCMERTQIAKTGITFGAENAGKGDTTYVGMLSKGSHGIQERLPVDQSKSITFGAEKVGMGDTTVMPKSSAGSYGIMERGTISSANSITFGAETSGVGDTSVVGKLVQSAPGANGTTASGAVSGINDVTIESVGSQMNNVKIEAEQSPSEPPSTVKIAESCPASVADVSDVIGKTAADDKTRFQAHGSTAMDDKTSFQAGVLLAAGRGGWLTATAEGEKTPCTSWTRPYSVGDRSGSRRLSRWPSARHMVQEHKRKF